MNEESLDEDEAGIPPIADIEGQPALDLPSQPAPEAPPDKRSAMEKARDLLAGGEEVQRRVKLLREMFNGHPIDESGRPLKI